MLREASVSTRSQEMASFRPRLKQLILERSLKDGKQLSQSEVARASGVSLATVQRWYKDDYTVDRVDADTLYGLLDYFGCKFEDLIERVDE